MTHSIRTLVSILVAASAAWGQEAPEPVRPKVTLQQLDGRCRIEIDGELFTEYRYKGFPNPVLYPVIGVSGVPMTRKFPVEAAAPDEAKDHRHHRSLWFAHGEVNGVDFWAGDGRIVQDRLIGSHGKNIATIVSKNRWLSGDDVVCRDTRTISFWADGAGRYIDYEVVLHASEGEVHFGDTKEGTMALRLAPSLRLRGKVARGKVVTSEGVRGLEAWGKRSKWVAYWGPVGDSTVGVALFDHPSNHGHPCRWHARDYGLFAANPWGIHHFEGAPKGAGDMALAKGKELRLRYRFFFFAGDAEAAGVAQRYRRFAALK